MPRNVHEEDLSPQPAQAQQTRCTEEEDCASVAQQQPDCDAIAARMNEAAARIAELERAMEHARAESDDVIRQTQRDIAQSSTYAIAGFAAALLPFKDSLEAALRVETSDINAFRSGLEIALKQLSAAFEKNGLIEIGPLPGAPFDPEKHRPSAKTEIGRTRLIVADTEQKGYAVAGRVIRPAVVRLMTGH